MPDPSSQMPTRTSQRSRSFLMLRGGGFSLISATEGSGGLVVRAMASASDKSAGFSVESQVQQLRKVLGVPAFRGLRVTVVLGDTWSRVHLLAVPQVGGDVARQMLQHQLGTGEAFCDSVVGSMREGNAVLEARLAITSATADLNALVRCLGECSIRIEALVSLDAVLLQWGKAFLPQPATGLRMVVMAEPSWLHFACYDGGRPAFIRRVETLPDLDPASRAASAITEIQRTVLVVRGRLKTPELEGVVLVDPIGLVDRTAAEAAAAPFGIAFESTRAAVHIEGAHSPAATGDAIRAAAADSVPARARRSIQVPCELLGRGARRGRVAAVIVFMILCAGTAVIIEKSKRGAAVGAATSSINVDAARESLAAMLGESHATMSKFDGEHRGLAGWLKARPPVARVLERIGPAIPPGAVIQKVSVNRSADPGDAGKARVGVKVEGLARGTLEETRPAVMAMHDALEAIPGVTRVVEEPVDLDPLGKEAVRPDRTLTRFVFAFQVETAP